MLKTSNLSLNENTQITLTLKGVVSCIIVLFIGIFLYSNITKSLDFVISSVESAQQNIIYIKRSIKENHLLYGKQVNIFENNILKCLTDKEDIAVFKNELNIIRQDIFTSYSNTWI